MNYINRYLEDIIFDPLFERQIKIITGPRQCGKTTLAKNKLKIENCENFYYNWDSPEIRRKYRIYGNFLPENNTKNKKWVCFDEIHKMPKWKNILKGFFDSYENQYNFLVTGSARIDILRRAGDSLTGRYFLFKLYPFILSEINGKSIKDIMVKDEAIDYITKNIENKNGEQEKMEDMLTYSGFPEPLLKSNERFLKMWNQEYFETVIRSDLKELSNLQFIEKAIDIIYLLTGKIGSPLSIESIAQDTELNFRTVKRYIDYLNINYLVFYIPTFTGNLKRLNKKMKKLFFYNYSLLQDEAARFENYVALELKVRTDLWNLLTKDKYDIFFIRNREGKETDFLIVKNSKPFFLCEVKLKDTHIETHHRYFAEKLGNIPFVQIVKEKDILKRENKNYFIVSASRFFN
jgi:predicted AAA+ superfamily ATPase